MRGPQKTPHRATRLLELEMCGNLDEEASSSSSHRKKKYHYSPRFTCFLPGEIAALLQLLCHYHPIVALGQRFSLAIRLLYYALPVAPGQERTLRHHINDSWGQHLYSYYMDHYAARSSASFYPPPLPFFLSSSPTTTDDDRSSSDFKRSSCCCGRSAFKFTGSAPNLSGIYGTGIQLSARLLRSISNPRSISTTTRGSDDVHSIGGDDGGDSSSTETQQIDDDREEEDLVLLEEKEENSYDRILQAWDFRDYWTTLFEQNQLDLIHLSLTQPDFLNTLCGRNILAGGGRGSTKNGRRLLDSVNKSPIVLDKEGVLKKLLLKSGRTDVPFALLPFQYGHLSLIKYLMEEENPKKSPRVAQTCWKDSIHLVTNDEKIGGVKRGGPLLLPAAMFHQLFTNPHLDLLHYLLVHQPDYLIDAETSMKTCLSILRSCCGTTTHSGNRNSSNNRIMEAVQQALALIIRLLVTNKISPKQNHDVTKKEDNEGDEEHKVDELVNYDPDDDDGSHQNRSLIYRIFNGRDPKGAGTTTSSGVSQSSSSGGELLAVCESRNETMLQQIALKYAEYLDGTVAQVDTGKSALHLAVETKSVSFVALLLAEKNRFNPHLALNHLDKKHETPLLLASKMGHREIAQLLVDAGADVTIPSAGGRTPEFFLKLVPTPREF